MDFGVKLRDLATNERGGLGRLRERERGVAGVCLRLRDVGLCV